MSPSTDRNLGMQCVLTWEIRGGDGLRPLGAFDTFRRPRSELGGFELLVEVCRSCASNSAIRFNATVSSASSSTTRFARSPIHPG